MLEIFVITIIKEGDILHKFALEFGNRIENSVSKETLSYILSELDVFCSGYDISKKDTSVSTYVEELPPEFQMFMIAKKVAGRSKNTLKQYTYHLVPFLYAINKKVCDITNTDIIVYLYTLQKNRNGSMSNRTLENIRLVLSSFFNWLHDNAYISINPMKSVQPIKYEKKEINPIDDEEFERIRTSFNDSRDRAVFETLFSTGCRIGELVKIKMQDIDVETREVRLFGKGQKHRTSFLNTRAVIAVKDYLKVRPKSDHQELFLNIRKPYNPVTIRGVQTMLNKRGKGILLDGNLHPHLLRHQLANEWVNKNLPVEELQQILGHEKLSTTQLYFKSSKERARSDHRRFIA